MKKLINHIVNTVPKEFFSLIEEEISAAFQKSHKLSDNYEVSEQLSMLGQNRHALCEAGFRKAAATNDLEVHAAHTNPVGGMFSWLKKDNIFILRSNVQPHYGTPRITKFRKSFSALNKWLDPYQYDLLHKAPEPPSDKICGMIVTASYKPRHGKPGIPAYIGFGIPNADLTNWRLLYSIGEILALYHDKKAPENMPQAKPVDIQDKAIPRLKKKPQDKNVQNKDSGN